VVLTVGAEALAVAIATSVMMLRDKGIRDDNCDDQKHCRQPGLDANNQISSLSPWNAAAWVVGAAGLGVGTVLVIMGGPNSDRKTALGVSPNGSGMGLQLRSTF
jgi:hypothetical protein